MKSKKTKLYKKVKGHIENYLNSNRFSIPFDYEGLRNIIYDESLKVTKNNIKKEKLIKEEGIRLAEISRLIQAKKELYENIEAINHTIKINKVALKTTQSKLKKSKKAEVIDAST